MSYCRQFLIKINKDNHFIYNFPQTYSWNTIDNILKNISKFYNYNIEIYPYFNSNLIEPSFNNTDYETDYDTDYDTEIE